MSVKGFRVREMRTISSHGSQGHADHGAGWDMQAIGEGVSAEGLASETDCNNSVRNFARCDFDVGRRLEWKVGNHTSLWAVQSTRFFHEAIQ